MFNIIHTYYNEKDFLKKQLEKYKQCSNYYNKIIIVDDASRTPAEPIIKNFNINIDVYRVIYDIGFNSHGCRNLGMDKTDTDWNLLIDIDWEIDIDTIKEINNFIKSGTTDNQKVYTFSISNKNKEAINVFLIHKDTFWAATGYDEELTNMHTGDDLFYESLKESGAILSRTIWEATPLRKGRKIIFSDVDITIYDNEKMVLYQPGSKTDWDTMRNAVARRNRLKGPKPIITFSWEKIL